MASGAQGAISEMSDNWKEGSGFLKVSKESIFDRTMLHICPFGT